MKSYESQPAGSLFVMVPPFMSGFRARLGFPCRLAVEGKNQRNIATGTFMLGEQIMSWILWALLAAVFAAATALLAKVGVAHVDSNLAMALRTTVVLIFAWGIVLALGKHGEIRSLDRRTVLFLTLSGLATGLSWICYFRALQLGPASRVAPLDKLSVPLVMIFAWLLLGEKLTPMVLLGGLLITAGAVVMVLS
jgi:transporter family protein